MTTWPKQWWCNHNKVARFGPPFSECSICHDLVHAPKVVEQPRRSPVFRVVSIVLLAGIVLAGVTYLMRML